MTPERGGEKRGSGPDHQRGEARALLVVNANIVDVVTQSTYLGWFTVTGGRFLEVETGEPPAALRESARRVVDLGGAFVQPGMLDIHMHIESSLVTPRRFAEAVLPHGTTAILQDPHEVANVLGAPGIKWMIDSSRGLRLRVYSAISSCVPATSSAIETPNASISPQEVSELAREPDVIALGEMMDFHGLIDGDAHLTAMLDAARQAGLSLEGHVPSLSGPELSRYIANGIRSDHTLMTPEKILEQLRKGMWVMIQEKSVTADVIDTIRQLPDRSRVLLITDDVMPNRLLTGHLDRVLTNAIDLGWDPLDALASATLRPATYLGLHDLGKIAPGAKADFVVTASAVTFPASSVYVGGEQVVEDGHLVKAITAPRVATAPAGVRESFAGGLFGPTSFQFAPSDGAVISGRPAHTVRTLHTVRARVIVVNDVNSFTTLEERDVSLEDGRPVDPDLTLATVIPRAAARLGADRFTPVICLVAGLGLEDGAYASSFAHDSHNVFVIGRDPEAMAAALDAVMAAGGGMAFTPSGDSAPTTLPLPLAGLLSDEPVAAVAEGFEAIEQGLRGAGVRAKNPVLLLTLLPLSVSPDFKVSDKGVVDVQGRRVLSPVVDA